LQQLVAQSPAAAKCKSKALAVLVFPKVVKAGFIVGAQSGEGILFERGRVTGRYRTVAASYGLQAGVQEYGYALFLMNQKAVDWVNNTRGWEIGTGPSVVIVDKGMARSFSTDTLHSGIYAFTFDQRGLIRPRAARLENYEARLMAFCLFRLYASAVQILSSGHTAARFICDSPPSRWCAILRESSAFRRGQSGSLTALAVCRE
jgi:hypothetical protein